LILLAGPWVLVRGLSGRPVHSCKPAALAGA
jgi:hypothetical protein